MRNIKGLVCLLLTACSSADFTVADKIDSVQDSRPSDGEIGPSDGFSDSGVDTAPPDAPNDVLDAVEASAEASVDSGRVDTGEPDTGKLDAGPTCAKTTTGYAECTRIVDAYCKAQVMVCLVGTYCNPSCAGWQCGMPQCRVYVHDSCATDPSAGKPVCADLGDKCVSDSESLSSPMVLARSPMPASCDDDRNQLGW